MKRSPSCPRMVVAATVFAALLSGCASPMLAPWQKRNLAKPEMLMSADPLEQRFDQHIYSSRENASGGYGVGGGGCGCN